MEREQARVVWLFPSLARGFYWQPLFREYLGFFPNMKIITGLWPGNQLEVEAELPVIQIDSRWSRQAGSGIVSRLSGLIGGLRVAWCLVRFRPKLIFTSGFSTWTGLAILLKPFFGWKAIIIVDGSSPEIDFRDSRFYLFLRRTMRRFVDGFVTNSQAGKRYLVEVVGSNEARVLAQPYLVPLPIFRTQPRSVDAGETDLTGLIRFLSVGRLVPEKGIKNLLHACDHVRRKGVHFHLMIVGDGPQRRELEDDIAGRSLQEFVTLVGWVAITDVARLVRQGDVVVFPSLSEVWGVAVLEAMAAGKPVICSRYAGAAELIEDGYNGYLVNPRVAAEIAEAMARFIKCPGLARQMGFLAAKRMERLTPEAAADFFRRASLSVLK